MVTCNRFECQSSAGCAYRGPRGEFCYFAGHFPSYSPIYPPMPPQGCVCPPTSEQTCKNPTCPRGGGQSFKVT